MNKILTAIELRKLKAWQRKMVITFVLAMLIIIIAVTLKLTIGLDRMLEWLFGLCFIVLTISGAYIQFSGKCPNCGKRIGLQSRLLLPGNCTRCKISFRDANHKPEQSGH